MFDPRKLFDMMKNAGEMQKVMAEKLKNTKVEAEAGGGMVKITMNGHFEVESLAIDDTLMKEQKEFVQDVIKSAINSATTQLRANMVDQLKGLTGGLGF